MKKAYTLIFSVVLSLLSHSQDIRIVDQSTTTVNGSYIYVVDSPSTVDISHNLWVENNSGQTLDIKVKRVEIAIVNGTENATCWVLCPPAIASGSNPEQISANTVTLDDGDFDYSFSAHLYPEGISGCSHYRYIFYDEAKDISDSVDIYFNHGESCNQVASMEDENEVSLNIYPNPASDVLNLKIVGNTTSTTVTITNILGSTVFDEKLSPRTEQHELPLADFESGLYFVTLKQNNKAVITKKIQVVR